MSADPAIPPRGRPPLGARCDVQLPLREEFDSRRLIPERLPQRTADLGEGGIELRDRHDLLTRLIQQLPLCPASALGFIEAGTIERRSGLIGARLQDTAFLRAEAVLARGAEIEIDDAQVPLARSGAR